MSFTKKAPLEAKNDLRANTISGSSNNLKSSKPLNQAKARSRIVVHYDVGYPNNLYIRGKGANLSWDRGILLKNVKPDEWVWETDETFENCEFKVLINDYIYETQENHKLKHGQNLEYTPLFPA